VWRRAVLALLRAAEALKPVLARVMPGRFGMPGALRAGEGPNGWGAEEYGRKEKSSQVNLRRSKDLRGGFFWRSCTGSISPGSAPSFLE